MTLGVGVAQGCVLGYALPLRRLEDWMPGKRVRFDDQTWQAIALLASDEGVAFQTLATEAFRDLLRKRGRPADLKAALRQSVCTSDNVHRFPGKKRAKPAKRAPR